MNDYLKIVSVFITWIYKLLFTKQLTTMSALRDRIVARIEARIQFKNAALKGLITAMNVGTFELADAVADVEGHALRLGLDPVSTTNATLGLAEQFGEAFPSPSPERSQKIKELVNELIDEDDDDFEASLENLFGKSLNFEVGISALNSGVDAIVPE